MDAVPVADQGEDQQRERDQEQPRGFRCVDRMAALPEIRSLLLGGRDANVMRGHTNIVAP